MKQVTFLGLRNDIPQILNSLDAFVYSTNFDTFGIAIVEAMAVGIPVFVNDWKVMEEITKKGKYATLYKTSDEFDLLRHFLLFLQNRIQYMDKANKATEFVRKQYSIQNHIINLKHLYNLLTPNS